jgi:hypothetical protein
MSRSSNGLHNYWWSRIFCGVDCELVACLKSSEYRGLIPDTRIRFRKLAETLEATEAKINAELIAGQGKPVNIGGYYPPDPA